MATGCTHYWIPKTTDKKGNAMFRINRKVDKEAVVRATCEKCDLRTWFTRSMWKKLPAANRKG